MSDLRHINKRMSNAPSSSNFRKDFAPWDMEVQVTCKAVCVISSQPLKYDGFQTLRTEVAKLKVSFFRYKKIFLLLEQPHYSAYTLRAFWKAGSHQKCILLFAYSKSLFLVNSCEVRSEQIF